MKAEPFLWINRAWPQRVILRLRPPPAPWGGRGRPEPPNPQPWCRRPDPSRGVLTLFPSGAGRVGELQPRGEDSGERPLWGPGRPKPRAAKTRNDGGGWSGLLSQQFGRG